MRSNFFGILMKGYSKELKLGVVQKYLSGEDSYGALSKRYGVDSAAVRKWVATYRIHGESGLEKKRNYYSAPFKISVLRHMRKHALSYRETAIYFDIRSIGSIGRWERQYDAGNIQALSPPP